MPAGSNDPRPAIAATISPLVSTGACADVRAAFERLSALGYRGAQLSAADPATRPRDLGASARRDLAAALSRSELSCSGVDLFITPAHFTDPAFVEKAADASFAALGLAADLGRAPLVLPLPADAATDVRAALAAEASRRGVAIVVPLDGASPEERSYADAPPFARGVDCAAVLAAGGRPEAVVAALGGRLGGVRLVDLLRSGLRGPILEPRASRLDALALRIAIELAGFRGLPVVDARQWADPDEGIAASIARWRDLGA
ncbi:MAG: hypothetical protein LW636_07980 [Planctomycetaceae bacterium]|nr:hypothetical protein [Planctomycetaceae bacterium]